MAYPEASHVTMPSPILECPAVFSLSPSCGGRGAVRVREGVTPCLSLPPLLGPAALSTDSPSHLKETSLGPSNPCYLWRAPNQGPPAALLSSEAPLLPCPLLLQITTSPLSAGVSASTVHLREISQASGHKRVEYSPYCLHFSLKKPLCKQQGESETET